MVINVLDSTNLERNLYLTTELIDMDRSMVVALNMYDELERSGDKFDYEAMGRMIGVPMSATLIVRRSRSKALIKSPSSSRIWAASVLTVAES